MSVATLDRDAGALLKAILDDPADDLPRLAYADWCEESGQDERAEFIRLHLWLGANAGSKWIWLEPSYLRARKLLWNNRGKWMPEGLEPNNVHRDHRTGFITSDGQQGSLTWSRGFPAIIRCHLDSWLQHGPALVRVHPLEWVELSDRVVRREPSWEDGFDPQPWIWIWFRGPLVTPLSQREWLPPGVMDLMPGRPILDGHLQFRTKEEAEAAASVGLIRWAKEQEQA